MTTIKNETGSKAVNISKDGTGVYRAFYVQIYNGSEQVLDSKDYSNFNRAAKWAEKVLN